jgi:hypothetical protein
MRDMGWENSNGLGHRVNTESEITVQGMKLIVIFNPRDRQLSARLDACASPDSCTAGNPVTVWQGP